MSGSRVRDCSEKPGAWIGLAREKRGLVTESPGRRQRPYCKIDR